MPDSKIGGVWDLENSPVPNTQEAAENLKTILQTQFPGKAIEFHVFYAEGGKLSQAQIDGPSRVEGFEVHKVRASGKDTADYALMCQLLSFVEKNKETPLTMLIGGDKDCISTLATLKEMGYNVVATSKLGTKEQPPKGMMSSSRWVKWESIFDGTASLLPTKKTNLSSPFNKLALQGPDDDILGVGVFMDLNSMEVMHSDHLTLLERVSSYVHMLKGVLCDFSAYGHSFNFPANYPNDYENNKVKKELVTYKYITTSNAKPKRLENCVISGIGKFMIQCTGKSKMIILITSNIRLSTAIISYCGLGLKIMLVTPPKGQALKESVGERVFCCEDWEDLPKHS